jgi:hypothetical protein
MSLSQEPCLRIGQTWRRRNSEVVTIVSQVDGPYPFQASDGSFYTPDGSYNLYLDTMQDLVEFLSEAPSN